MKHRNSTKLPLVALCATSMLAGCATFKPPEISYDDPVEATLIADPPRPVQIVERPEPLPLPGQLMRIDADDRPPEATEPTERITNANAAARIEPVRDGFINAVQLYPYSSGALYQVYTAPGQVTDIALQAGESLVGSGPIAAGDTARWIIGDTESGTGDNRRIHILVKPTRPDLLTNLVINTDRRTYHLELRATPQAYMASVSWQYPEDELIALRRQNAQSEAALPIGRNVDLTNVNFRYRITGDRAPWRPR
ncbi:MAG: TrbG/VirB9 family P-type conjugative transfer protein, partial [Pseudomonadota bacterium]